MSDIPAPSCRANQHSFGSVAVAALLFLLTYTPAAFPQPSLALQACVPILQLTYEPEAQAKRHPSLALQACVPCLQLTYEPEAQAKRHPSLALQACVPILQLTYEPEAQAKRHPSLALQACVPILASGWSLKRGWNYVEATLNDRRRMIQVAVLGMIIGIYIMMRRYSV